MPWQPKKATSGGISAILLALCFGAPAAPAGAQSALPPSLADPDDAPASALAALRRARNTLMGIKDFDAALNPARAAVAAQEQERDAAFAEDLAALALIEAELRDFTGAEDHYLQAIELIADAEGEYSVTLIDFYRGLGRSYIRGARYPEAITTLEQAQHITQRNLGLFNVEQAPLIDDITTAYLGLGDTIEARRMQLERLDNAIRRFGANDPRVIPFRYVLANYYERSRLQNSAREQYEEVLKSQEAQLGATHPALLAPLRQVVKIDLLNTQGQEHESRERLVALLEQNADADSLERGLSLALLGDWATVTGDPLAARGYYQQAWATLLSNADVDVPEYFAKPATIDFIAPLNAVDRATRSSPYAWGQISFRFDVSADGLPSNVEVVGDAPPGPLLARYARRLRETHFRPRLVAGEPAPTSGAQFTHYFRYYVEEE
jgi:tetratricopeptide (TPR) repeat protein